MESIISCPQCGRQVRITEDVVGRRVRCRECATIFIAGVPAAAAPAQSSSTRKSAPTGSAQRAGRPPDPATDLSLIDDADRGATETFSPGVIPLGIKSDPARKLKGIYMATLVPGGMELRQRKKEPVRIAVGSLVELDEKNRITVEVEGREVTLSVGRINNYTERLARDLAAYLRGGKRSLRPSDYVIPWYIVGAALLPIPMVAVFLAGGAIGGAIGGAFVGGLVSLNLAMARKETWPVGARLGACVGVSAAAYLVFALGLFALFGAGALGQSTAWGTPEDPRGDCRISIARTGATIEVPGVVHELTPPPGQLEAPRILRSIEAGDFDLVVKVVGDDLPADPPASGARISFHGAGLILWADGDNLIRFERASLVRNGQVQRYLLFEHLRPNGFQAEQDRAYSGGPISLRLTRRGTQVTAAFSPDGVHWQTLSSENFVDGPIKGGVAAVNTCSAPFSARFEEFRVVKP